MHQIRPSPHHIHIKCLPCRAVVLVHRMPRGPKASGRGREQESTSPSTERIRPGPANSPFRRRHESRPPINQGRLARLTSSPHQGRDECHKDVWSFPSERSQSSSGESLAGGISPLWNAWRLQSVPPTSSTLRRRVHKRSSSFFPPSSTPPPPPPSPLPSTIFSSPGLFLPSLLPFIPPEQSLPLSHFPSSPPLPTVESLLHSLLPSTAPQGPITNRRRRPPPPPPALFTPSYVKAAKAGEEQREGEREEGTQPRKEEKKEQPIKAPP